ncbi:MAG: transporter substrate-binding domain-containing protein [Magnetospirillum sp.]|nr:transporter substrate-binding domain-containing protein [Magnetospirillum sp.]
MRALRGWTIAAGFAVALLPTLAAAAESMRIAFEDAELPPFYLGSTAEIDPVKPGISVELVKMAAAQLGIDIKLTRMPWVRCQAALKQGQVDAIFQGSYREERREIGVYPMAGDKPDHARRIATVSYSLFRQKGNKVSWDGKMVSDLNGPVGVPNGYSIGGDLKDKGIAVELAQNSRINFTKLSLGRVGAVATLDVTGEDLLASGAFPTLEKLSPPLVTKDYFVMVSHRFYGEKPEVAEKLWAKIAQLREAKGAELNRKYAE